MEEKFKHGYVVVLKSGGHHMTVASINGTQVSCQWFVPIGDNAVVKHGKYYMPGLESGEFHKEALVLISK